MLAATNEQIIILTAVHSIPAISQLVASLYTLKFGHTAAELQWRSYVYEPALNGCYSPAPRAMAKEQTKPKISAEIRPKAEIRFRLGRNRTPIFKFRFRLGRNRNPITNFGLNRKFRPKF